MTVPGAAPRQVSGLPVSAIGAEVGALGVAAGIYALLLIAGERLLADPDTFWHIAAGRWIWARGAVPTTDPFSHTLLAAPWHAHEWLAELILAGAYGAGGWAAVVALTALAAAAALARLFAALGSLVRPTVALAATALAFLLMAPHLTARPHALALPLLVGWSAGLIRARAEGRAPTLWLLPLMTLWANLHGGFVVGLALAGFFALEAVLLAPDRSARGAALRGWGGFLLGAAASSLLTPSGIAGWLFPFRLLGLSYALNFVAEWHAPDFAVLQPLELWLLTLLGFLLLLGVRVPVLRLLALLGSVHLALAHSRDAELLALLAPLMLAQPVAEVLPAPSGAGGRPSRRAAAVTAGLVALMTGVAALHGGYHQSPKIAPAAALAAARRADLTGPVFNDYDFGGYLIFSGVPVFADGRIDLYGDAFMREYGAALDGKEALPRLLDRYRVEWTLLEPGTPAVAALDRMAGWERVYADAAAVVHRRR